MATVLAALLLLPIPAAAAADPPERETIVVFGDSQAQGVAGGLQHLLLGNTKFRVLNRTHPGAALVHNEESEWLEPIRRFVAGEKADFAVVMVGANDRLDMRMPGSGAYLHFKSDVWRSEYERRVDLILTTLTSAGLKVLWLGNPIARSAKYSEDMVYLNQLLAERAAKFGVHFYPLWQVIADGQGEYTAYGKDLEGVVTRLRTDDGIHFTAAGYELIADKIMSQLPSVATAAPTPTTAEQAPGSATIAPASAPAGAQPWLPPPPQLPAPPPAAADQLPAPAAADAPAR